MRGSQEERKKGEYIASIVSNRLLYTAILELPSPPPPNSHWFSIDEALVYWNFFLDFGPLNLGQLYRFCMLLNDKLRRPELEKKTIYYCASAQPQQRTNGAFLIAAWQILYMNKTPDEAYHSIAHFDLEAFHDATPHECTFRLTVLDCLKGLHRAHTFGFFSFDKFELNEYEYFEAVENGDLNWIVKDKIFAFAGPQDVSHLTRKKSHSSNDYNALTPEHFIPYFMKKNVQLIVRLNKPYYQASKFTAIGADFADLYYLDGSNPPLRILQKFITIAEKCQGAFGVHCKAGLGRTGTCIGAFLMKHFKFSAEEIIGYMRICRPGSVIGQQQHFMKDIQANLWRQGDAYRAARRLPPINPSSTSKIYTAPSNNYNSLTTKFSHCALSDNSSQNSKSKQHNRSPPRNDDNDHTQNSQGDQLRRRRQQQQLTASKVI